MHYWGSSVSRLSVCHRANSKMDHNSHSHSHLRAISSSQLDLFCVSLGCWRKPGAPRGNPRRHGEKHVHCTYREGPGRSVGRFKPRTFLL